MKTYIGLVGEKLAGKDTVANYLVKKHDAFHIRFTHILDEILTALDLPLSRRNEIDLGLGLRKIFGDGILGKAVVKRALAAKEDFVVINGIRMDEMKNVKEIGAKVIYVTAPINLRFERYKQRHVKADDGIMSFEQFKDQEKELTEVGIPELGKQADFKIENTGTPEDLFKKVDEIINSLV
jgi:dephospho-CoA kinase